MIGVLNDLSSRAMTNNEGLLAYVCGAGVTIVMKGKAEALRHCIEWGKPRADSGLPFFHAYLHRYFRTQKPYPSQQHRSIMSSIVPSSHHSSFIIYTCKRLRWELTQYDRTKSRTAFNLRHVCNHNSALQFCGSAAASQASCAKTAVYNVFL